MSVKQVLSTVKSYFIITVGLLLYVLAWTIFITPNRLVGGGVTGISAIIQYITGFNMSYSYFIINFVLLLIALKVLGKKFGVKTVYAMLLATILLKVLPMVIPDNFIQEIAVSNGKMLSALIGGAMAGMGIAMTFTQGGSSGGTDIVALIISKYRSVSPGTVIVTLDIIIIACSLLIPSSEGWGFRLATVIYGYVIASVSSFSLDLFISGSRQSVQIMVFSKKYEEIADRINNEVGRGVTLLDGQGWYTKQEGKIALIIARKSEARLIMNVIKEVDSTAFVSETSAKGVYGLGFDSIKK